LATGLCNSGVLAVDGARFADWVETIGNANAKGEYYLTDLVGIAVAEGRECEVVEGDQAELLGVDSRAGLATAEAALQARLRAAAMQGGTTLADPDTVYFSHDTKLGRDVTIGPNVVFGPGVTVADHVEIRAFCHIDGAEIESGAIIGPFARLRPGAAIGPDVHIGNFVEIKNASLAAGAKANHLAYIGDASVGAGANIGAGTITCNYDGYLKTVTEIGARAFIGSNTALVAPVRVGDGAVTGAGSVITRDVEADALAVARGLQTEIPGWAAKRRAKQADKKPDQD
jgi:bifunctional UDP-N-acetylglucosamine pyrophosphorylase/glucosamine-1-phosphate N-acetyltransferase